jgi:hypothetical protein
MTLFQITVVNHDFESTSEQELSDLHAARFAGLKSAIDIGEDQILAGCPIFGAEVIISHGEERDRFILSIGTSPLK